jgi:hypothetical protein
MLALCIQILTIGNPAPKYEGILDAAGRRFAVARTTRSFFRTQLAPRIGGRSLVVDNHVVVVMKVSRNEIFARR